MRVAIAVFALLAIMAVPTAAKTWYVDDSGGPGIDFTSIQDAIDTASAGDTIIVYNGTYHENIKVNQQLNLIGVSMPVVDAGEFGIAINISADGCLLRGFKVVNSGFKHSDAGIYVDSDNNLISDNEAVLNYRHGIYLHYSNNNTISNNRANSNNDRGISLKYSSNNTISNNSANWNHEDGIFLGGPSKYNTVSNNNASNNFDEGIYLFDSCYNIISNNNAHSNKFDGLRIDGSCNNTLSSNNAYLNTKHGIYLFSSFKNLLYHNHLVNNTNSDARDDDGNNQWYNATLCEGNYYSDYTGIDADRDGIGDTPYSIPGSSGSQDLYPMMKHFETKPTVSISTDKYEYSLGDTMNITIRLENPTEIKQRVTFDCYLILLDYNLSYEIMSEELVLTSGFNRSFVIPLDVEYWAPIEFNATWYITLHNSTTSKITAQSTADWRYSPVTKLQGKLNPSEIAEEIVNKVAEVELPG